jgi:hypothetical protein
MNKSQSAMMEVIATLTEAGFVPDGETRKETVRIPTTKAPVYGGIGGELTTMGGRQRFHLPETNIKATVGPRTTAIYRVVERKSQFIGTFDTKDLTLIQQALGELKPVHH